MCFERLREAAELSIRSREDGHFSSSNEVGVDSDHFVCGVARLGGLVRAHKLLNGRAISSM